MQSKWSFNWIILIRPCFFITVFYFIIAIVYKRITAVPEFNYYRKAEGYVSKPFSHEPKAILLWNAFFDNRNWYLPGNLVNETFFIAQKCPATNCFITSDRKVLDDEREFDAIVFHTAEAFPLLNPFPVKRDPGQIYVFATMESPAHTKHDLSDEVDFYNITMTYRLDSDIVWSYGNLQDTETGQLVSPNIRRLWREPSQNWELEPSLEAVLSGKNKTAAWFVSHCDTISKRDRLARALQQHIQVDIYGQCGSLSCPKDSTKCDEKLDSQYKFYLSFENSLCTDYITEKFFKMLNRNIVPVVYGGADYTKFAPPHSYINVEDYATVEDLANYLKFLDGNPAEYKKYFWWKKYYKPAKLSPFCDLCALLNNPADRERVRYYKDIQEWWFGHNCRLKPKIKL